jgi:hypothetical protein
MPELARNSPAVLNSWKEIASYLGRGVRTVQRWERQLQLPVHRAGSGKRSPVYALVPELKFWLVTAGFAPIDKAEVAVPIGRRSQKAGAVSPVATSRRLMSESLQLVRNVAETSVRQQRQAEALQKRILEIRSRLVGH